MRVLINTAVWGKNYCDIFLQYSISSLLSPSNLPRLSIEHRVTIQIISSKKDLNYLRTSALVNDLANYASIELVPFEVIFEEDIKAPTGNSGQKYGFLSKLQNYAMHSSKKFDCVMFNYADFVWSNGSLSNTVKALKPNVNSVLGFCLPVDKAACLAELEKFRVNDASKNMICLNIPAREATGIAIKKMHREALLRYWNGPAFSMTPSYIMWPVAGQGLVLRAYHQTVLALRIKSDDSNFFNGITGGSLDGHFTTLLAEKGNNAFAKNSDNIFVFSLYETDVNTKIGGPSWGENAGKEGKFSKWDSMRECVSSVVTPAQRSLSEVAFEFRVRYNDKASWSRVIEQSSAIINQVNKTTPFDVEAYEYANRPPGWVAPPKHNPFTSKLSFSIINSLLPRLKNYFLARLDDHDRQILKWIIRKVKFTSLRLRISTVPDDRGLLNSKFLRKQTEHLSDLTKLLTIVAQTENEIKYSSSWSLAVSKLMSGETHLRKFLAVNTDHILATYLLAKNLWFQTRFQEAKNEFGRVEHLRAKEFDPSQTNIILPPETVTSVGLMGHLDGLLKKDILLSKKHRYILPVPDQSQITNITLLDYWSEFIEIVSDAEKLKKIQPVYHYVPNSLHWTTTDLDEKLDHIHNVFAQVQGEWFQKKGQPLLKLKVEHRLLLERQLRSWGIGPDDWFVCLHVRGAGFYAEPSIGGSQDFRNTSINDYFEAIKYVISVGGWVIRMGDSSHPKVEKTFLGSQQFKLIDYANSNEKNDALDVALCASCELMISSPSGLHTISDAFGRRVCLLNYPLWQGIPWNPENIFIPKLYYCTKYRRVLSLAEVFSRGLFYYDQGFMFEKEGVELINNTPEEIMETVKQALLRDKYTKKFNFADKKVNKEFSRLKTRFRNHSPAKIGAFFASNHEEKLIDASITMPFIRPHYPIVKELELDNDKKIIDIVVPTFNRPRVLFRLLSSFMDARLSGVRMVIIDDASFVSEKIENIGPMNTADVCAYFKSNRVFYTKNPKNIGVPKSWRRYYDDICDVKYTMSMTDKDIILPGNGILRAAGKMDDDPTISLVVMPMLQIDRSGTHETKIEFPYSEKVSGKKFLEMYVNDPALQHCSMWGLIRSSEIKKAGCPRDMRLRDQGLDDGFGIDVDLIFNIVCKNDVAFEKTMHVKRSTVSGGTEKYPLTFAYTYYQYASRVVAEFEKLGYMSKRTAKTYRKWWLLLIFRGLDVAFRHVHGTELEKGTDRIKQHLKMPLLMYLFRELIKHRIAPNTEMFKRLLSAYLSILNLR